MWNDPENEILNRFSAKKEYLKKIYGEGYRIRSPNQHGDIWIENSICEVDVLDIFLAEN